MYPSEKYLFVGDSVTDCGWRDAYPPLGNGYVSLLAPAIQKRAVGAQVVNRGVSGSRVRDLRARWGEDCLDLRPALVSILVGINDTWRRYDSNDPTGTEDFARDYRYLLESLQETAAEVRLVLLEPFLLPVEASQADWAEDLNPKVERIRQLASEFRATFVPLGAILADEANRTSARELAADGVHPTALGHQVIAEAWLDKVSP